MARRKISLEGRTVEGEDIQFEINKDGHVLLALEDGAQLRVRPVILDVFKTDETTPEGEPLYIIRSIMQATLVSWPTETQAEEKKE